MPTFDVPVEPAAPSPVVDATLNPFAEPTASLNPFAEPTASWNPFAEKPASFTSPVVQPPEVASPTIEPIIASPIVEVPAPAEAPAPAEMPSAVEVPAPIEVFAPVEARVAASPIVEVPSTFDAPVAASPIIEVPASVEAPVVAAPFEAPASDSEAPASASIEAGLFSSPIVEQAVVASLIAAPPAAVVEAPVVESPPPEPVISVEAPVIANAAEPELAAEPSREALDTQTDSFATAATEVPVSETPITLAAERQAPSLTSDSVDFTQTASETPVQLEPAAAEAAPVEAADTLSAESVVGEHEVQDQPPSDVQAYPAPAGPPRSFTSSGSEMPVVISAPAPRKSESSSPASRWLEVGREVLPRAHTWSRKTLRTAPRALVVTAPFIALFGIWAVHSMVSRNKQADSAQSSTSTETALPTPTPRVTAAENAAPPASAILVSTSAAPAPKPPEAESAELSSAVSRGLPALEALAQKFPSDPQVGIALASQQAQAQRFEAAVASIERVVSVAPQSAQNGKVMGILWRAAQSSASEPSFSALRKLGGRGSDIAFDLATTSGVRESVRDRAKKELKNSLSADASEDTRVATALLLAPNCGARKALLARAEREGGKRTLAMLDRFARGAACTSTNDPACNTCLTGTPELAHAQAQLGSGAKP